LIAITERKLVYLKLILNWFFKKNGMGGGGAEFLSEGSAVGSQNAAIIKQSV
jgi:hypothetical protein